MNPAACASEAHVGGFACVVRFVTAGSVSHTAVISCARAEGTYNANVAQIKKPATMGLWYFLRKRKNIITKFSILQFTIFNEFSMLQFSKNASQILFANRKLGIENSVASRSSRLAAARGS